MAQYVIDDRTSYYPGNFATRIVNFIIGLIEALLALRLVLLLLGANAGSPFVAWVYNVTGSLIGPFMGAFPAWNIGGFILDLSTLFAMIGYAIIGWLILQLLAFLFDALP